MSQPNWYCAQIGAREHYAVARALHKQGQLATLYTDFWAGPVVRNLAVGRLRSLAARFHPELNDQPSVVRSWNVQSLGWEFLQRRKFNGERAVSAGQSAYHGFIEVGRDFAKRVRDDLKNRLRPKQDAIFYAYDTGALEALEWCRKQGVKCILNQMDPNRVEVDLVRAEEKQWPGWALQAVQVPETYFARREQEWLLADRIVVNSEFSRQALQQQGVPAEKMAVVPLCYESGGPAGTPKSRNLDQPLRVLFLGQVILRKGVQYLMEAARRLTGENIRFDIVGPVGISAGAMATAPANVTFHGRTGRDQISNWYRQAHLFILPTLSDGFAITQLEAMTHGLAVITTPCCGEVVSDGVDGFVVPPRNVEAFVKALQSYLDQPAQLPAHSAAALRKAGEFTLDRLGANLSALEAGLR